MVTVLPTGNGPSCFGVIVMVTVLPTGNGPSCFGVICAALTAALAAADAASYDNGFVGMGMGTVMLGCFGCSRVFNDGLLFTAALEPEAYACAAET
jgi:hypothetical protein